MTLAALAEDLSSSAREHGNVSLDRGGFEKAGLTPPPDLESLVARAFGEEPLILATTPDQIGEATATKLTITGGLTALGLKASRVTVVFTAAGAAVDFTLEAPLPSSWSLAQGFPALARFPFEAVALTQPSYLFSTGAVLGYPWPGGAVDLSPGLNFAALAVPGEALAPLLELVPAANPQPILAGRIDPSAISKSLQMPDLALFAELHDGPLLQVGFLELADAKLGLEVRKQQTAQGWAQYSYAYLRSNLGADGRQLLDCRVEASPSSSLLTVRVDAADAKHPITIEDISALMGGRSWYSSIPAPLQSLFTSFGFAAFTATIVPEKGKSSLSSVEVTVASTEPWPLFDDWYVERVEFSWAVRNLGGTPRVSAAFGGAAHFFPTLFTGVFYLRIDTDLQLNAAYEGTLKLSQVLAKLAPGTKLPEHMEVELTGLAVGIDMPRRAFALAAGANASIDVLGNGTLSLQDVELTLAKAPGSAAASLDGTIVIGKTAFGLAASYDSGAWNFEGGLEPGSAIELGALVNDLLAGVGLPEFVPGKLQVTPLSLLADVPAGKGAKGSYQLDAGTKWVLDASGSVLDGLEIDTAVKLAYDGAADKSTGSLSGEARLPLPAPLQGMTFDVVLGYELTTDDERLWIDWRGFAKASYSLHKDEVTFSLDAASLGDLLAELVRIVEGDPGFTLPPPWNLLNQISLKAFSVTWRLGAKPGESPVDVNYDFEGNNINLFFIEISKLGFSAKNGQVQISLTARMLGEKKFERLDFPAQQPPPAPGGGTSKFELDLLAAGQRVSVAGLEQAKSIEAAVKTLQSFKPPQDPNSLPVTAHGTGGQPYYEPSSAWIFGTRFKVLVDKNSGKALLLLEAVFNDPQLYGLRIVLGGEKAGSLAGLDFEVLYRKVSATVGVYHVELTLPEAMRHIELGEVSVTLPVVGLDVYTNGNFRVDFGFPANLDFSRSAGVQAFPFVGQGGFYFGVLGSQTAGDKVPATTRGSFDPVIVFGIGLRIGLGKSIDEGIFSAELSVTVFGIVEGVLAVFHPFTPALGNGGTAVVAPASPALQDQYYWWLQGTFGVIGKISGTISFAIVKASVDITVQAFVKFTVEAHRAIPVHVEAGVSVAITITIDLGLFSINLHFSFSLTVKGDFTIGQNSLAPWDGPSLPAPTVAIPAAPAARSFAPLLVDAAIPLTVYAAPQLTLADWTTGTTPAAAYVAMLYVDGPVGQGASEAPTGFETLARETLLWVLANFGEGGGRNRGEALAAEVTRAQVQAAFAHFAAAGDAPPVAWPEIRDFLSTHFELSVQAPPSEGLKSAAALPMLPDLTLTVPAWEGEPGRTVDFATEATCGAEYLAALQKLLAELAVDLETELERKHASAATATRPGDAAEQSLATFIAEDWFALICRQMLQSSLDAFDRFAYRLPDSSSLLEIATQFPAANGLTPAAIGLANADLPLAPAAAVAIEGVTHTVAATDSLGGIAASFGLQPLEIAAANEELQGLLVAGATLTIAGRPYEVGPRDSFAKIVAATKAALAEVAAAVAAAGEGVLVPLAALSIPPFVHPAAADGSDTLASLGAAYGLGPAAIAAANPTANPFFRFDPGATVVEIPGLTAVSAEALIAALHDSQDYAHLAGISARFLLNGLRLPVEAGIRLEPGAPCAGGEDCGLQALLGQQVTLPPLHTADAGKYALTLARGAGGGWIRLGPNGTALAMVVDQAQIERIEAVLTKAAPALLPDTLAIAALPATVGVKRRFALTAALPLRLPAGLQMPEGTVAAPTLLTLPEGLLAVLADRSRARPAFSLQRTDPGAGGGVTVTPVASSAWATLVPVTVGRLPDAAPGTYELIGTDQAGTVLLERLLEEIGEGGAPIYGTPQVLFPPAATDPQPTGLAGADRDTVSAYLVQANLSTETGPPRRRGAILGAGSSSVANDPAELVRLLWECSIVASGGFYLYYEAAPGSPDLPEHLFDAQGEATVQLLIQLADPTDGLGPYVNAALLGEAIDPGLTTVFAQSEPRAVAHTVGATDSLAGIAAGLHLTVAELAAQMEAVPLRPGGPPLTVEWASYETRAGDTLAALAAAFGTSEAAIKAANPELSINWAQLPPWTVLRLPRLSASVSASGPATLGELAAAYALSPAALGWLNRDLAGIFKVTGSAVTIEDGIVDATATLPPGVAGFAVERRQLQPQAPDEVATYLDASFHLLGWELAENVDFAASPPGLPVSPGEQLGAEQLRRLRQERLAPQVPDGSAPLSYQRLFPVAPYAKDDPAAKSDTAAAASASPPAAADPYAGIGSIAQPRLEWRDLFGNRARTPLTDPALDPGGPANLPPVPIAYADRLLAVSQWPGVAVSYTVGTGAAGPQIELTISFDPTRYQGGDEAARRNAEADRATYALAWYQLEQKAPDGTPHVEVVLTATLDAEQQHVLSGPALAAVKGFVLAAWQYLDDLLSNRGATPPEDAKLAVPVAASNPTDVFELTVAIALARDQRWVADESRDEDGVARAKTVVAPLAVVAKDSTASLLAFAEAFERAYAAAPVLLKLAVGAGREEEGGGGDGRRRLWAVRTSSDLSVGIGAEVDGPAAYYAPPPLATALVSRNGVPIRSFDPEHGLGPAPGDPHDFTDVDLDAWARQALEAIDGALSYRTSMPAFVVDARGGSDWLGRLLAAKRTLAAKVAGRVENVLEQPPVADPGPALADAREHWEQLLLVTLASAYQADVAVQFPVKVRTGAEGGFEPPALYGHPVASAAEAELGTSSTFAVAPSTTKSYLTFTFTAAEPSAQTSIGLDLGYQVDMVEHEIASVPGIAGYKASSWLTFPLPLGPLPLENGEFGKLEVPVVLRAYPTPPTLGEQASRSEADPENARTAVQTAADWAFLANYDQVHVAQDRIDASAEVNVPGAAAGLNGDGEIEDGFAALARLLAVLPQLQSIFEADLAAVTTQTPVSSPVLLRAGNALAAFTELVEQVALRWGELATAADLGAEPQGETARFAVRERPHASPDGEQLLIVVENERLPFGVPVPAVEIPGYEAVATNGGSRYRKAAAGPYLGWEEGRAIPARTIALAPLDARHVQNARLGLQITRNADLVEGNPTRAEFVYTTPLVRFPSVCTPLLDSADPIDVAAVATGTPRQATLAEHLEALFSTLLAGAEGSRRLKLQASFRFPLDGEAALPAVELPIRLGPAVELEIPGAWEPGGFVEAAAAALKQWLAETEVAADGALAFEISLFSSLAATTLPLLHLGNLELALANVTDV